MSKSRTHWHSVATDWKYFGPPLRPSEEDCAYFEEQIIHYTNSISGPEHPLTVQLCGVTPELATLNWPDNVRLIAIEQSDEMIREVWPGDITNRRMAVQGNWLDPLPNNELADIVIGDGCFISFPYPDGYQALAKRLYDNLKPDGLFLMRFFVRPQRQEAVEDVFDDLLSGRIGSFHVFKWRLAMSLQEGEKRRVNLDDIYRIWKEKSVDLNYLTKSLNWLENEIDTISLYKDKKNHFSFSTLEEALNILELDFEQLSIHTPGYELGDRCPIISCIKKATYPSS